MYMGVVLNGSVLNMSRWYIGSRGFGVAKFRFIDDSAQEKYHAQNTMCCTECLCYNYLHGNKGYCACGNKRLVN